MTLVGRPCRNAPITSLVLLSVPGRVPQVSCSTLPATVKDPGLVKATNAILYSRGLVSIVPLAVDSTELH